MPSTMGIPLFDSNQSLYMMLEIHIDNPSLKSGTFYNLTSFKCLRKSLSMWMNDLQQQSVILDFCYRLTLPIRLWNRTKSAQLPLALQMTGMG